ncbi:uncharacterized protein LOC119569686, partial [Penaeus monodon]|uniref:uncharacterized protein LOC119569686 n=1 Tax=Penaeus monodon TaxID=6687 RepID=UPI0018A6E17F
MSWLSINLNDSLNSLKGQISTLTKEVLSEEIEDATINKKIKSKDATTTKHPYTVTPKRTPNIVPVGKNEGSCPEEIEDESGDEQIVVPRDQIKALEAQINLQRHELEESRKTRLEMEERLHAGDLHAAHQLGILRKQLEEQEKELRNYKA